MFSLVCLLAAWLSLSVGGGVLAQDDNVRSIPVSVQDGDYVRSQTDERQLRTHSLAAPYLDSDMNSRFWDFGGDTVVRADRYIRLASDQQSRSGWLFSKIPLTATNWEIEFEFKIHGKGSLFGDGMAMWITKQRGQQGDVFGSVDRFEGLGIFFDTYRNNRPGTVFPYVMAMVGDGQTSYNKGNDGRDQELAGCSARQIRAATIPTKGRLTYYQDKSLKLELQYRSEDKWETCFDVSEPVKIPSVAYLGFSAETGQLSDNFDVVEVATKNLYSTQSGSDAKANTKSKSKTKNSQRRPNNKISNDQEGGGWGWFFVKVILFVLVCGGGYVGFTVYRTQKRGSRFD